MTDITIPPVALEAGENAFCEAWDRDEPALLAFAIAMLKAWPGAIHNGHWLLFPHTKLLLPQEASDE